MKKIKDWEKLFSECSLKDRILINATVKHTAKAIFDDIEKWIDTLPIYIWITHHQNLLSI